MNVNLLKKFQDLVKENKIILVDDSDGIRVNYTLTDEELSDFLKLDNKGTSNDLSAEFQNVITQIVDLATEEAKRQGQDTKASS